MKRGADRGVDLPVEPLDALPSPADSHPEASTPAPGAPSSDNQPWPPEEAAAEEKKPAAAKRLVLAPGRTMNVKRGLLRGGDELLPTDMPKAEAAELLGIGFLVER